MIQFRFNILKIALLVGAIFLFCQESLAQKDWLELLPGSEQLSFDEKTGVQRLIGNINFTYQGNLMFCDSAHYNPKSKEVWAYGKVHLNKQDTLNLYCDSLYYNGAQKLAKLWGHVRVRDREYKLTTDSLDYETKIGKAIYKNGGKFENSLKKEVLTSKFGYFFPNTEDCFFSGKVKYTSPELKVNADTLRYDYLSHRLYFHGNAVVVNKSKTILTPFGWYDVQTEEAYLKGGATLLEAPRMLKADTIHYQPNQKKYFAFGKVFFQDTTNKVELHGGKFVGNDSTRIDVITRLPWLKQLQKKDTLYLCADTLIHIRDTTNKSIGIKGFGKVKLFHRQMQAIAEKMKFDRNTHEFVFTDKPVFWSKNAELKGDTLSIWMKNDSVIEKVHLRNNAFSVNEVDSGSYYNQIAGREIWSFFNNNEIVKSTVIGTARTVYFPTDTLKSDTLIQVVRKGMNRLYAAEIRVYWKNDEVNSISFVKSPDGLFYPMDQLNKEEQFIPGFTWTPFLRPKSPDEIMYRR